MAKFQVPSDVNVNDFFEKYVPDQFKDTRRCQSFVSSRQGSQSSVQREWSEILFEYQGRNESECCERRRWKTPADTVLNRTGISGRSHRKRFQVMIDRFTDPVEIADPMRLKNLMDTKGTLNLTKQDAKHPIPVTTI